MVMGILLAVWGIALLAFGFKTNAQDALSEAAVNGVSGGEETLVYLLAGGLALIIGLILMFKPDKSRARLVKK